MQKYLTAILLFLVAVCKMEAQTVEVSGIVVDNGDKGVAGAVVVLTSQLDTTKTVHTVTDTLGTFLLRGLAPGRYTCDVNILGYKQYHDSFLITDIQPTIKVLLHQDEFFIKAAMVSDKYMGFEIKKDTIVYNPIAYSDGHEEVIGDVLRKLPGVEVDASGKVRAQGESVSSILINGTNLFKNNVQVATQTIPAEIADKIEVISNYSEFDILNGFQSYEQKVINVRVKDSFLGALTGKIAGAAGVKNKYDTKNTVLSINKKSMLSVSAISNNIGEPLLSLSDYVTLKGGLNSLISSIDDNFEINDDLVDFMFTDRNVSNNLSGLVPVNFFFQPNKNLKMEFSCLLNINKTKSEDSSDYSYLDASDSFSNKSYHEQKSASIISNIDLLYSTKYHNNIHYYGAFNYLNTSTNGYDDEIIFRCDNKSEKRKFETRHELAYIIDLGANVISFSGSASYNNKPSVNSYFYSPFLALPYESFSQYSENYLFQNFRESQGIISSSITYLHKFSDKTFLKICLGAKYHEDCIDYSNLPSKETQTSYFRGNSTQNAEVKLTKNKGFFQFFAGGSVGNISLSHKNIDISNIRRCYFTPSLGITIVPSMAHRVMLSYSEDYKPTDFIFYLPINRIASYKSYYEKGYSNNKLKKSNRLQLIYIGVSQYNNIQVNFNSFIEKSANNVATDYYREKTFTKILFRPSPVEYNVYANLEFSKRFAIAPLGVKVKTSYLQNRYSSFIKSNEIEIKQYSPDCSINLESYYKQNINFGINASYHYSNYISNQDFSQQWVESKALLSWTKRNLYLSSSFNYLLNLIDEQMINKYDIGFSLRYKLERYKLQFEVSGENILHLGENRWDEKSLSENCIMVNHMQTIPGHIVAKVAYLIK